jgi:hypothetical protein
MRALVDAEYAPLKLPWTWASGNDQPQFYTELDDGGEGLYGPMGNINDDRAFRGGKRWEGTSKSGITCVIELLPEGEVEVCGKRRIESFWTCCIIKGHDGPHIPITDELKSVTPEGHIYVITEMRRRG